MIRLTRVVGAIGALVVGFTLAGMAPASAQPTPHGDYCLQVLEGGSAKCFASEQALESHQTAAAITPLLTVFDDVTRNEASAGDLSKDYFDTGATVDKDISSFVIKAYSYCVVTATTPTRRASTVLT